MNQVKSAIILVGGMGTRMQPLTYSTPKPMLLLAGIPFTEHQIVKAREAGIEEIVLATSYLPEVFKPHFGDGSRFGINISYAVEESALGTGGAIRNASTLLKTDGPVVIFNGDVLSSHDLTEQMDLHISNAADVTLYLTEVSDARAFGVVELSAAGRVLTFNEKMENPPSQIINAGCYIFSRDVIDEIPAGEVISVERSTFPELLARGSKIYGFLDSSYWLDIGTPSALLKATSDLISGVAKSSAFDSALARQFIRRTGAGATGPEAIIHLGASIEDGTFIGEAATIFESRVSHCSIGSGAVVGLKSVLINTFVAPGFSVPPGTMADGAFLGF